MYKLVLKISNKFYYKPYKIQSLEKIMNSQIIRYEKQIKQILIVNQEYKKCLLLPSYTFFLNF